MKEEMVHITRRPDGIFELSCAQHVARGIREVFSFFSDAGNLQRITPPSLQFRVTTPEPIEMGRGRVIDYKLRVHGIPIRWRSRIEIWDPPHRFVDLQLSGPYRLWRHEHRFEHVNDGTMISDTVEYRPPGGAIINWLFVRRDVARIFDYRQRCMMQMFG